MANRTYLYAQKDNEFTGIGEFRYDAPFLALLFTHVDTVAIPSLFFDLGDIKVGAFRGRLETTQVTDFVTKLRALFDAHRSKILPKIWEEIEPSFADITETIDRITAGGYTHVLMDPVERVLLIAGSDEEILEEVDRIESELDDYDPDWWLKHTETTLRSGALLDEEQAWWFLRELGLTGFFSPILYFNLQ
ncbi:MAG: hypothetical protein ACFN4E_05195 [Corynebacterium matruchotii]